MDGFYDRLAPLVTMAREPVQALPERLLGRHHAACEFAEEEVVPELPDVRVVALARRLDADEASDYGGGRIARVARRRKQPLPAGHAFVAI